MNLYLDQFLVQTQSGNNSKKYRIVLDGNDKYRIQYRELLGSNEPSFQY